MNTYDFIHTNKLGLPSAVTLIAAIPVVPVESNENINLF